MIKVTPNGIVTDKYNYNAQENNDLIITESLIVIIFIHINSSEWLMIN